MTPEQRQLRQENFGAYVLELRKQNDLTIKDVAESIGVSINLISLIERGQRPPSDQMIRGYSKLFGIDQVDLYTIIDRIAPHIKDTLKEHEGFRKLVSELTSTVKEEELRQELYEEVYSVYEEFLKRHNLKIKGSKTRV